MHGCKLTGWSPFFRTRSEGYSRNGPKEISPGVLAACLKHRLQGLNLRREQDAQSRNPVSLATTRSRPFSPSKLQASAVKLALVLLTQTEMPTGRKIVFSDAKRLLQHNSPNNAHSSSERHGTVETENVPRAFIFRLPSACLTGAKKLT